MHMEYLGQPLNDEIVNSAVLAYSHLGQRNLGWDIWLKYEKPQLSVKNYKFLMNHVLLEANVEPVNQLLDSMKKHNILPSIEIFKIIIVAFAKAEKIAAALNYYHQMKDYKVQGNF